MTKPLQLIFNTQSRDSLIMLAIRIGGCLYEIEQDNPIVVLLNGSYGSGKSLFPLSFDFVFNRLKYPDGIKKDIVIDGMGEDILISKDVVFRNFATVIESKSGGLDTRLHDFAQKHRSSRIAVASNICRRDKDRFNFDASQIERAAFDMHILVRGHAENFKRKITVTFKDGAVYEKMKSRALISAEGLEFVG